MELEGVRKFFFSDLPLASYYVLCTKPWKILSFRISAGGRGNILADDYHFVARKNVKVYRIKKYGGVTE